MDVWSAEGEVVAVDAGVDADDIDGDEDDIDNVIDEDIEDIAVAKVNEADGENDENDEDTRVLDVEEGEKVGVLVTEEEEAAGEEAYTDVIDAPGSTDDGTGVPKEEGSSSLIIDETSKPRSSGKIAGSDRLGDTDEVRAEDTVDGDGTGVRTKAV